MKTYNIYLYHFGIRLVCLLPRSLTIVIVKVMVAIRYLYAQREKNVVRKNLSYCDVPNTPKNVFKTFINYGIYLSDLFRTPIYNKESLEKIIEFEGKDNITNALSSNRGVIIITGHVGNWDLSGVFLASLGFPLTAVAEEVSELSDIFNFFRTRTGMEIVFLKEINKMLFALNNNRALCLLADRDLTGRGIKVKFLSGEKMIPRGPAAFACKYKTPILFSYCVLNTGEKPYRFKISKPIFPRNETREQLSQMIANRLSNYIKQYPTQWFVFQDEWEDSFPIQLKQEVISKN